MKVEGKEIEWVHSEQKGVRYYIHPSKKYREGGDSGPYKKDRCYVIRYQANGKRYERVIGWASQKDPADGKYWNELKAASLRATLMGNAKNYQEEKTPEDIRAKAKAEEEAKIAEQSRHDEEAVTVSDYFDKTYLPWCEDSKAANTIRAEKLLFNNWIKPYIGNIPLIEVAPFDIEKIKKTMNDKGKSQKTIHLTLASIRQIYNHAKRGGKFSGDHPVSKVKMPTIDNAKLRYLMPKEINGLLAKLKEKSLIVHDQAIIAVNCGLRFSEVAGLRSEDVNYDTGTLAIRDSKTGSRTVFMNEDVVAILKALQERKKKEKNIKKKKSEWLFPDDDGSRQERCSKTFQRVADELFNNNVKDRRLRVSFHTLRHTFGTHVYANSGDLYLTQKALGHKTMVMAARYAKMGETRLKEAFTKMSEIMTKGREATQDQTEQVVNLQK